MFGLTPFSYLPKTIQKLLIINLVVFILCYFAINGKNETLLGIVNYLPFHKSALESFQIWRFLTYMFTHFDLWHVAFNMLGLWSIGPVVVQALGEKKFLGFYLFSGVFSLLVSFPFMNGLVIGASGALFALFYAFTYYYPHQKVLLFFVIPVEAKKLLIGSIFVSLFLGITGTGGGIAHFTHVGGILAGFLFYKFFVGKASLFESKTSKGWNKWKKQKDKAEEWQEHVAQRANVNDDTFFEKDDRLDRILQKIGRYGMDSLEPEEKKYIDEYSLREQIRKGKVVSLEDEKRKKNDE